MSCFAQQNLSKRAVLLSEAAARLGTTPVIVEKDYWVCWLLGLLFADPRWEPHLVFKGGTSLSKVFHAIQRFSEDIDLSVSPIRLGYPEVDLEDAPSKTMRGKRFKRLQTACEAMVADELQTDLEALVTERLGGPRKTRSWFRYELDRRTASPILWFMYDSVLPAEGGYIVPAVKLEFGSLTNQRPIGRHTIRPMMMTALPSLQSEPYEVVVMDVERTFWEKATILHAEYHRPASQPIGERFSRHYSDFAALWRHPAGRLALDRIDLLPQVALFKSRFFGSAWANYDQAVPGTLRLLPPVHRESELMHDYHLMLPMFLNTPPSFAEVLNTLRDAETQINAA